MPTVFDYIKSINDKNYIFDEDDCSEYIEPVINKGLSYFQDTIYLVAEAEKLGLTGRQHYDFLFYTISKRKRFSKWAKKEKDDEIDVLSDYFYVNKDKAKAIKKVLTKEQIEEIKEKQYDY